MNVLITGSNGQLGNELMKQLTVGGSEIGAVDPRYVDRSNDDNLMGVDIDSLDITDAEAVGAFVLQQNPDLIINCAAMTNVDGCETDFETAMKVNAIGPRNLAVAAQRIGAKLIHVSTDYVFPGTGSRPYCEWDTPAPNTVYGKSKLLGEQYVMSFCDTAFVVRTAWLYGYIGNNFVKTMLRLGAEKPSISVVSDQRGNPTSAADLAHHLLKLGQTEEYGIYHCTGEGECSWYEFACRIMQQAGLPCQVKPCTTAEYPSKTPRPAYSSLDNLMLKCTVGNDMRPWQDALDMYIRNLKAMEE